MTPEQLAEIEARAEAATPGPWTARRDVIDDLHFGPGECTVIDAPRRNLCAVVSLPLADAEFIAHARADVPDLVAEVRRLRRDLDVVLTLTRRAAAEHAEGHSGTCHTFHASCLAVRIRRALAPVADPDPHTTSDKET